MPKFNHREIESILYDLDKPGELEADLLRFRKGLIARVMLAKFDFAESILKERKIRGEVENIPYAKIRRILYECLDQKVTEEDALSKINKIKKKTEQYLNKRGYDEKYYRHVLSYYDLSSNPNALRQLRESKK